MTPDERDRLVRVEEGLRQQVAAAARMEAAQAIMDDKLDQILAAAAIGKGAWLTFMKIGAFLAALAGGVAWIIDHGGRLIAR